MIFNTQLLVTSALGAYTMAQKTMNLPVYLGVGSAVFYGVSLYFAYQTYSEFKEMVQSGGGSSGGA